MRAADSPYAPPTWSCSGRGLPCQPCYQRCGGLLPHPFTLTLWPKRRGGLLSVALSLGSRRAAVSRRPVHLEPGLSSSMGLPPYQRLPGHLVRRRISGVWGRSANGGSGLTEGEAERRSKTQEGTTLSRASCLPVCFESVYRDTVLALDFGLRSTSGSGDNPFERITLHHPPDPDVRLFRRTLPCPSPRCTTGGLLACG